LRQDTLERAIAGAVAAQSVIEANGILVSANEVDKLSKTVETTLDGFHRQAPLSRGMPREAVRETVFARLADEVFQYVLSAMETASLMITDRETVRKVSHAATLSPEESKVLDNLRTAFTTAGLEVPRLDDALAAAVSGTAFDIESARRYFQFLKESGELVKVTDEFYFSREAIDGLAKILRDHAAKSADKLIDVSKFKELAGVSRKYAIPLLEYFDREHVTARSGDKRIIL
jgi:selenocysteine-specific elongation factor